jgi:hypothetical protein
VATEVAYQVHRSNSQAQACGAVMLITAALAKNKVAQMMMVRMFASQD